MTSVRMISRSLAAIVGSVVVVGCSASPSPVPPVTTSTQRPASPSVSTVGKTNCTYVQAGNPVKKVHKPNGSGVSTAGKAEFTLAMEEGDVKISLDRSKAPCTVNSFESLVKQGYFDGTSCHRLVTEGIFILQCGDPSASGRGGPGYRFADELSGSEKYPAGTVAMANAGPDTNGSQFFLVFSDTSLPPKYTVFGTMDASSTAIIAGIAKKGVDPKRSPAPLSPAKISKAVVG